MNQWKTRLEIAIALDKMGVKTTLIAGPSEIVTPKSIKLKKITSANDMLSEVKKTLPVDLVVCSCSNRF